MPTRTFTRLVLYVLLLSSQLWPGAAMSVHATEAPAHGRAAHSMPCHGTSDEGSETARPACKDRCCPHMTCDAGTCATLACLPAIAVVAHVPSPAAATVSCDHETPLRRLLETPLRPPIA